MGYRLTRNRDCYFKRRRVCVRPDSRATVQVKLREHGWYDVASIEAGSVESSILLRGVRMLQQWEQFAFCK